MFYGYKMDKREQILKEALSNIKSFRKKNPELIDKLNNKMEMDIVSNNISSDNLKSIIFNYAKNLNEEKRKKLLNNISEVKKQKTAKPRAFAVLR